MQSVESIVRAASEAAKPASGFRVWVWGFGFRVRGLRFGV